MAVTTQREECTATVRRRLLMSMRTGPTAMEAGVHHGRGTTPAPAHALDRRVESIAGGDRPPSCGFDFRPMRRSAVVTRPARMGFGCRGISPSRGRNLVVGLVSIEVNRRAQHAKTDRMDVEKLFAMLLRYVGGEQTVWRMCGVPTEVDEHRRPSCIGNC